MDSREQERTELYKRIWNAATDLVHSGVVDAWDFKQYVLCTMFYRYISEKITDYINKIEHEAGDKNFDYAEKSDEEAEKIKSQIVQSLGFFILPSELFENLRKRASKSDNELNENMEKILKNIENSAKGTESEEDFVGLFDDFDVNSKKLGATVNMRNKKLVKLLNAVGEMKLRHINGENQIDAFGDAYEYLMGMYASNAGKKGGEFFTPQEVSALLTRIAIDGKKEVNKVYDQITPYMIRLLNSRFLANPLITIGI